MEEMCLPPSGKFHGTPLPLMDIHQIYDARLRLFFEDIFERRGEGREEGRGGKASKTGINQLDFENED